MKPSNQGYCLRLTVSSIMSAAVLWAVAACGRTPPAIGPAGMQPLPSETLSSWVDQLVPGDFRLYNLRWRYQTQQGRSAGRAAVRFAPPDSIRFDYRAPFGRSGAAMLAADSIVWSTSEEEGGRFIQVAPLFWAALGIPRPPPATARVYGLDAETVRGWRYVQQGDTLTYVVSRVPGNSLQAELRQSGTIIGLVEVTFEGDLGRPSAATMRFPTDAAVVTFTITDIEEVDGLDPEIWKRP